MGRFDDRTVLPAAVQRAWELGDDAALIAALGELPLPFFHSAARELGWLVSGPGVGRRTSLWERLRALLSGRHCVTGRLGLASSIIAAMYGRLP